MDYLAVGNLMVDTIVFRDGSSIDQLGGPAPFAYTGIKLWTDNCKLVCNVGKDFPVYFGAWCKTNSVNTDSIQILTEHCNHTQLGYNEDGTYGITDYMEPPSMQSIMEYIENMGYLKIRPKDIEDAIGSEPVKGLYIARNCDPVFWEALGKIKDAHSLEIMWEIETAHARAENLDHVMYALQWVDIFSINLPECSALFAIEDEQQIIRRLQTLPVEMTLFRVGARGLYVVTKTDAYFFPSASNNGIVDQTGCGNSSTGAALYAFCETHDPLCVGTIANVASSINIEHKGLISDLNVARTCAQNRREQLEPEYRASVSGG